MSSSQSPSLLESTHGVVPAPTILVAGHFPYAAELDLQSLESVGVISTPQQEHNFRVLSVATPDRILVAVSQLGPFVSGYSTPSEIAKVSVFDYEDAKKRELAVFAGHSGCVAGLECPPPRSLMESPRIVSGGQQSDLFIWNGIDGTEIARLPDPPPTTWRIKCFPELKKQQSSEEVFVSGGTLHEGTLQLHNLERNLCVHQFPVFSSHVYGLSADYDREVLFSVDGNADLKVWSFDTRECLKTIPMSEYSSSLCYASEQNLTASGESGGFVEFWDSRNLTKSVATVRVSSGPFDDVEDVIYCSSQEFSPSIIGKSQKGLFVAASASQKPDNVFLLTPEGVKKKTSLPGDCSGCCLPFAASTRLDYLLLSDRESTEERLAFLMDEDQQLIRNAVLSIRIDVVGEITLRLSRGLILFALE